MANAYSGSKTVLVQMFLRGHPDLPAEYRRHESLPREDNANTSEEILHLKGASGPDIIGTLATAGLDLVDTYHDKRTNGVGKDYTILTYLFGKVSAEKPPISDERRAALGRFLERRYDHVVVRKIVAADDSHFFHTIVFSGDSAVGIAPERLKLVEHENFGLAEIRSKGKSKSRKDPVAA